MNGIMIQGTASNVGKSLIVTALCRIITNLGYSVAPFKSQNMSNFTQKLADGLEISRAQVIQAEAAKQIPTVWMNPIVLKPTSEESAETIILGKSLGTVGGHNYRGDYYEMGMAAIKQSLMALDKHDVIIMEGAGSPVEMNLRDKELVNMSIATLADVPVILVADIERGGVFASIVGTLALLTAPERERVQGIIINKFTGEPGAFMDGIQWIEKYTGLPVLGVIPRVQHAIAAEDALSGQIQPDVTRVPETGDRYEDLAAKLGNYLDGNRILDIIKRRDVR